MASPGSDPDALVETAGDGATRPANVGTWSWSALAVAPVLLVGVFLGPQGLSLLTPAVLSAIDPAVPVALAAVGCLIGLEPRLRWPAARGLTFAALAHGLLTAAAVAAGLAALTGRAATLAGMWPLPLVAGLSAASSLAMPRRRASDGPWRTGTIVDVEAIWLIVAGGLVLAATRATSAADAAALLAQSLVIVALIAGAGWLFVRHTARPTEGRVFAVGTVLLVGGMADYLSLAPLLAGLVAGWLWQRLSGPSRETLEHEVLYAQHPFVALVLIVAGARSEVTAETVGLAVGYACLRLLARLAGTATLHRRLPSALGDTPWALVAPGIVGVAFALTVVRTAGTHHPEAVTALSIVVLGTVIADAVSLAVTRRGGGA